MNLCSFKWNRPIPSLVSNCNPTGLWIPNVSKCNGWIKLLKWFLKVLYDATFVIFISSLFHSFITLEKKRVHKILCPAVKRWNIFIISSYIRTRCGPDKIVRYFGDFRLKRLCLRQSLRIHRLSLRYSRPSSLYNFSLDLPLIGPVTARLALILNRF